jgi:hypothetical protein
MIFEIGLLAVLSFLLLRWGRRKGFFQWEKPVGWNPSIRLWHVAGAFLLYFGISFLMPTLYIPILRQLGLDQSPVGFSSWLIFLLSSSIFGALVIYLCCISPATRRAIWRQSGKHSTKSDVQNGLLAFLLASPPVLLLGHILESVTVKIFHLTEMPDQTAVRFVKMTLEHPPYFLLAFLSISILAPLIEETLFRGFLQSFIRKHLGSTQAIWITAVCFSVFHFSFDQGVSNIPIIGSLFCLALFLGFLYEKQRSLLASITLHTAFNTFSLLNLYFLGDLL